MGKKTRKQPVRLISLYASATRGGDKAIYNANYKHVKVLRPLSRAAISNKWKRKIYIALNKFLAPSPAGVLESLLLSSSLSASA